MSFRDHIAHRMNVLRTLTKSPHLPYVMCHDYSGDTSSMPNPGYLGIENCGLNGYRVYEITNVFGGERNLAEGMKVRECIQFINGAIMALEGRIRVYGSGDD